jgi:hypothetical protein
MAARIDKIRPEDEFLGNNWIFYAITEHGVECYSKKESLKDLPEGTVIVGAHDRAPVYFRKV